MGENFLKAIKTICGFVILPCVLLVDLQAFAWVVQDKAYHNKSDVKGYIVDHETIEDNGDGSTTTTLTGKGDNSISKTISSDETQATVKINYDGNNVNIVGTDNEDGTVTIQGQENVGAVTTKTVSE